ncbi:hypothetical protein F5B22DRAFT_197192 [Xylaria bambusicola]|uniref:uncharacterized protein n=1 Tax=Xylaria bambusicola TaxID=326684 RepID=UPI0020089A78|nr:uncharacterized protein F5B22DRAFT_197192 [Xylaria bambusicola]KAI0515296.1 hypothetical protein F5B22DRAFT_197192 [Xylaria bambusicola]
MEKIVSKGLMMGAAIMFTAMHREHTIYNCVTFGLFSLGTAAHIASLRVTNLALYLLIAIPFPSALAAAAVCLPQFIPALGYMPVIIAFWLWMIEDCSNLHSEVYCLPPWWSHAMHPDVARSTATENTVGIHDLVGPDYRVDDGDDNDHESLLLKYMWTPSQSCAPSSRLSDISLSSSGLESLPSSWGTLTRIWFPEFSAQGDDLCRRSRTV